MIDIKSNASPMAANNDVKSAPKITNLAMIGSGWNKEGTSFINVSFDRGVDYDKLASHLKAGRRLSLQAITSEKSLAKTPDRKFVLVLRGQE